MSWVYGSQAGHCPGDLCSASRHSGTIAAVDSERLANDRDLQTTFAVAVQNHFTALADPFDDVE